MHLVLSGHMHRFQAIGFPSSGDQQRPPQLVVGNGGVALAFFGDGASNQGTTFESLNLATVWKLPCVFIAENNGYAEATASSWSVSCEDISTRAEGFGMPGVTVDGHDFFAVHEATKEAVERARNGGGPTLPRTADSGRGLSPIYQRFAELRHT